MKHLIFLALLSTMIGCASQPSTYEDTSTPEQRNIKATGQAATEAARSNSSRHGDIKTTSTAPIKLSSNAKYDLENGRYVVLRPDGSRDHRAELRLLQERSQYNRSGYGSYTRDRWKRQFDYKMKRKIDEEVQRVIDKIF
jgi:hypothetical protein